MFERYTLSCTYFPSQSFDKTGCDYFLFPMPGKKDHVTVNIYYLLGDQKGIHTEEVDLLDFKEWNDLPNWYPIFQIPYQIDAKVTCTGFYVYIEIKTIQVTNSYGCFTTSPATKITSAIIDVKIDKRLQFQVNRLNITRATSIETRTKLSFQNLNFYVPFITLTLTYLYSPFYNFNMSTPTNIPETPVGEIEQDSFFEFKGKSQLQLQDIFQTILRLTGPDQFDQLCQWMEYKQYLTIDDFYENSYNDPEKFDTKGPATEYKWKGKVNHISPNVAQKLKSFVRWMNHEDRPYELHDDFLATLTRESYLKSRHMDTLSSSASSPSHHEPSKLKTSFSGESKHQPTSES